VERDARSADAARGEPPLAEESFPLERAFAQTTRTRWRAPIEALDFRRQAEAGRARINRWVESETASRIRELLPPGSVTSDTALPEAKLAREGDVLRARALGETVMACS
jgi:serine protease inhibitor